MSLRRDQFGDFFAAVHGGYRPFAWQERLLDTLLATGEWPDQIVAPTGAGKTAAIDVHVFAVALTATGHGPRVPRRLAMVVGRRVLVDDQYEHALEVADALRHPLEGILTEVSRQLRALSRPDATSIEPEASSPLVTARLRGGEPPSHMWRDHPTACAVLCATPDMWGSRLLFRGYGSSQRAWPREAGLLAFDSAVIVDEAHLSRQIITTARRVAHLATLGERPLGVPPLQVVETTATPPDGTGGQSVGVDQPDLDDGVLASRLTRPKPVTLVPVKDWPAAQPKSNPKLAKHLADAVAGLLNSDSPVADGPVHTVGCFVNTVGMAVSVAAELRTRSVGQRPIRVVMICGQIRPADLHRLRQEYPGLLTPAGHSDVDVIVTTQSLEVGVDIDLAGLVTELASGSALAQRAGRVNRRGLRAQGPVVVMVPAGDVSTAMRSGPYESEDLREALDWLRGRQSSPGGLSPWSLREHAAPVATSRRTLWQRPELADAWFWSRTSDDLAAEPELELWLSDSFDEDTGVEVVVRDALPTDAAAAGELLRYLPPRQYEVFAVPYRTALEALSVGPPDGLLRMRLRGDDKPQQVSMRQAADGEVRPDIRPGDLIVLDSKEMLFTPSRVDGRFTPPVFVAPAVDAIDTAARVTAEDVLERPDGAVGAGDVVFRVESGVGGRSAKEAGEFLASLAAELAGMEGPAQIRKVTLAHLQGLTTENSEMQPQVRLLLKEPAKYSEVRLMPGEFPVRLLIIDRRRVGNDENLRQTMTPSGGRVTLADHQGDVARRAAVLGEQLGLEQELIEALRTAGEHHDEGKSDPRFQVLLAAKDSDVLMAKSPGVSTVTQIERHRQQSGLPRGWRHEQRSVVQCWSGLRGRADVDGQLVVRLVGTSHGCGRPGFPHAAAQLLLPDELQDLHALAVDLFDDGAWDDVIEKTHQRWGVWGCAYLEAVLRAADGQISQEGR